MNVPWNAGLRFRDATRWVLRSGVWAVASGFLIAFTACSEHSQELNEQITQLQKELDGTQTELEATKQALKASNDELARLKTSPGGTRVVSKPTANNSTALASRESFEASYTTTAKTLKKQIQAELKDFSLDTCTLHTVQMPSSDYPVTSTVSLSLRSRAGVSFQLDFPVKADSAGKWFFPEVGEIVRRIEETNKTIEGKSAPESGQASSRTAAMQERPVSTSAGLPANATVVIQWPDSGRSSGPRNPSGAATPVDASGKDGTNSSKPVAPTPKGNIPADREVLIKF